MDREKGVTKNNISFADVVKGRLNKEKKEETIDETKEIRENHNPVLIKRLNLEGEEITEAINHLEGRFIFKVGLKEIEGKLFNQCSRPLAENSKDGSEEDDSSEEEDDMFESLEDDSSERSYEQEHGGQKSRQDSVVQETCMSASEGVKEIPTDFRQEGVYERENKYGENQLELGVIECVSDGVKEQLYGESTKSNKTEMREISFSMCAGENTQHMGGTPPSIPITSPRFTLHSINQPLSPRSLPSSPHIVLITRSEINRKKEIVCSRCESILISILDYFEMLVSLLKFHVDDS
ncbi:hypothetical protein L2E82_30593 [Cichorium intybus]|uniref:Uncharacterized protein n=1 Tax=Cichorium intybus TaxID=13427 RepID=A0ACB9D196_CICIN|nr:hypothetical protein L2E82_30593 [Cichorium intybus]